MGPLKKVNWGYSLTGAYNSHSMHTEAHTRTLYTIIANLSRSFVSIQKVFFHRDFVLQILCCLVVTHHSFAFSVSLLRVSRSVQWKYERLKLLYTQDSMNAFQCSQIKFSAMRTLLWRELQLHRYQQNQSKKKGQRVLTFSLDFIQHHLTLTSVVICVGWESCCAPNKTLVTAVSCVLYQHIQFSAWSARVWAKRTNPSFCFYVNQRRCTGSNNDQWVCMGHRSAVDCWAL